MLKKLKEKWGISTPFQMIIVFVVFGVTGSVAAKISGPIVSLLPIDNLPGLIYWPLRLLITVSYTHLTLPTILLV